MVEAYTRVILEKCFSLFFEFVCVVWTDRKTGR
jgi:hypothetical protein